jgi:hypothetical protein
MIGAIIGIVLLLILIYILVIVFSTKSTLIDYADATSMTTIPATSLSNPTSTNYTYSIWFYIKDWNTGYGTVKTIFTRAGMCPTLSLGATDNNLTTTITLSDGSKSTCEIEDIPIQTWTNILVSVSTNSVDVYMNGKLVKTCVFAKVPTIPASDAAITVTPNGGFSGYTARLKYWSTAVGPQEAWNNYMVGPGGNLFSNFLNQYKLQFNFIKGTDTQLSVTI